MPMENSEMIRKVIIDVKWKSQRIDFHSVSASANNGPLKERSNT